MRDDVPRTSKFEKAIQRRLAQQPQAGAWAEVGHLEAFEKEHVCCDPKLLACYIANKERSSRMPQAN